MTPGISRVGAHATAAAHKAAAAAQSFTTDDTAVEATASRLTVRTTHHTFVSLLARTGADLCWAERRACDPTHA
jgi:hypothetical protein